MRKLLSLLPLLAVPAFSRAQARFAAPTSYATNVDAARALTADLNRDNVPDFVIAGGGANKVAVLLSQASGGYTTTTYNTTGFCGGVALGSFNCDQYADLWVSDFDAGAVLVLAGQLGGTFTSAATLPVTGSPQHVAAGNLDADFLTDFVAVEKAGGQLSVRLHTAAVCTASYAPTANYATKAGAFSADFTRLTDVNRDGRLDAVVVNQANTSQQGISVLLNTGGGTFGAATGYGTGTAPPADLAISDLNGDNYPDAVLASPDNSQVVVVPGQAGAVLFGAPATYPAGGAPAAVAVADFDADNRPDVAALLRNGQVVVLFGQAGGTLGPAVAQRTVPVNGSQQLLVADFNADNRPDLAVASAGAVQVLLNQPAALPVQLVRFLARRVASGVQLTWETASELNNQGFDIERSRDGLSWQVLGTVAGYGTTLQPHSYAFEDKASYVQAYYRLAQRDQNGQVTYSPVRAVSADEAPHLYPNPSTGGLVNVDAAGDVQVRNALGQLVPVMRRSSGQIQLAQPGLYIVEWPAAAGEAPRREKLTVY